MKLSAKLFLVLYLLLVCSFCSAQQKAGLRVFISVDMEGIAGVSDRTQLSPTGFEYERARRLMTSEANAAIEGALAAGATKVTVADGHGNGLSILPEELNPAASLIRSWPRPLGMMDGIDQGYDAAVLIGYHASINTPDALLAHTLSSAGFYDVKLNGKHASEAMISAATAGMFHVPTVLVSGDDRAVAEVRETISPEIRGVVVKRAIGYESAESISPRAAHDKIRTAATEALRQLPSIRPYTISNPVQVEIAFKNMINAELFAYLPSVERIDGSTIRFTGADMKVARKFLSFVGEVAR